MTSLSYLSACVLHWFMSVQLMPYGCNAARTAWSPFTPRLASHRAIEFPQLAEARAFICVKLVDGDDSPGNLSDDGCLGGACMSYLFGKQAGHFIGRQRVGIIEWRTPAQQPQIAMRYQRLERRFPLVIAHRTLPPHDSPISEFKFLGATPSPPRSVPLLDLKGEALQWHVTIAQDIFDH